LSFSGEEAYSVAMKLTDLSPSRLIILSLAGYLLAASGFALMSSRTFAHLGHRVGIVPCLLVCFFFICLGVVLAYKTATAIGEGVRLERWSQADLQTPRRIFEGAVCRAIGLGVIVVAFFLLLAELATHHHGLNQFCMPILYLSFWISGIQRSLQEPRPSQMPPSRVPAARLQSQHWGH
jgi:hypothetical protein